MNLKKLVHIVFIVLLMSSYAHAKNSFDVSKKGDLEIKDNLGTMQFLADDNINNMIDDNFKIDNFAINTIEYSSIDKINFSDFLVNPYLVNLISDPKDQLFGIAPFQLI